MDTLTILKTMRAVVADVDATRFYMPEWFIERDGCGCVLGLTIHSQPLLAEQLGLRLQHGGYISALRNINGNSLYNNEAGWHEIAQIVGISVDDVQHLFNTWRYERAMQIGSAGKAEALRRLDEMIAKYTPSGTDERAEPRRIEQSA